MNARVCQLPMADQEHRLNPQNGIPPQSAHSENPLSTSSTNYLRQACSNTLSNHASNIQNLDVECGDQPSHENNGPSDQEPSNDHLSATQQRDDELNRRISMFEYRINQLEQDVDHFHVMRQFDQMAMDDSAHAQDRYDRGPSLRYGGPSPPFRRCGPASRLPPRVGLHFSPPERRWSPAPVDRPEPRDVHHHEQPGRGRGTTYTYHFNNCSNCTGFENGGSWR